MRIPARHGRKDANHSEIVEALERVGCGVVDMSPLGKGVPDLLVSVKNRYGRHLVLMEIKTAAGKVRKSQLAFEAEGWEVFLVRSVEDALRVVLKTRSAWWGSRCE